MAETSGTATLEAKLIEAFRPYINESAPSLMAVLRRSLRFAEIDENARTIVVDRNAFLLGMVSVGIERTPTTFPNTSTWFTDWLKSRIEAPLLKKRLADAEVAMSLLIRAQQLSHSIAPSRSMLGVLPKAVEYANWTMGRSTAALRHLFIAVATDGGHVLEIPGLEWTLSSDDRPRLISHLKTEISRSPDAEEDVEKWSLILDDIRAGTPSEAARKTPARIPTPALLLSGFSADRTRSGKRGNAAVDDDDPLGTRADVQAMARLICHQDADPPISIGIFGGWGSGKSTFMERLQDEVIALTGNKRKKAHRAKFVAPVVQVRFNAWQFADADLWASLTAEFFDQLRAGGFRGQGERIHATLVEDVNQHVRGLSEEAAKSRAALTDADEKLRKAKLDRAQALANQRQKVGQAAVSALVEAYQRNRGQLLRLGVMPRAADEELSRFVEIAREANSQWGQAKVIGRTVKAHWPIASCVLLALGGIAYAGYANWGGLGAIAATAATALPLVAALLRTTRALIDQLSPLAAKLREADDQGLNDVLEKELVLRAAEDEAEALREAAARADRALARYVDPKAPSNPPRLLRYLLEDDPETKLFEKEIGLMGRARRLFEALDTIVQDRQNAGKAGKDIPARIILYIDDLDRCTHDQVYRVLQAVHLLLAFRLFVVIVAVDVKWVEGAVQKHLEVVGGDAGDAVEDKRARSIEYLSKIFQLPFWLKPLSGRDDTRFAAYVQSLTGPGLISAGSDAHKPPSGTEAEAGDKDGPNAGKRAGTSDGAGIGGASTLEPRRDRKATKEKTIESALKAMEIDAREVAFLSSATIAAIASADPRGVKRLVNVYKIVRSRLSEIDDFMILGDETQAPSYPLIALTAAIETGQPYQVADLFYQRLREQGKGAKLIKAASVGWGPAIHEAVNAALVERGGRDATYDEVLAVARVVRRYSFNRYH